jgi:hypothetical protein
MLRIWLMTMIAAAMFVGARDHDVLHRAGLLGYCSSSPTPPGANGHWRACEKGVLDGRPDLSRHSCSRRGLTAKVEYWSCPAALRSHAVG